MGVGEDWGKMEVLSGRVGEELKLGMVDLENEMR